MSDEGITQTFVDPETGDSDDVTFPREMNGWTYNPDSNLSAIVWEHPEGEPYTVRWEKTGDRAWSAWISVPGLSPRNTIYTTKLSPSEALDEAKRIMRTYSPSEAEDADW